MCDVEADEGEAVTLFSRVGDCRYPRPIVRMDPLRPGDQADKDAASQRSAAIFSSVITCSSAQDMLASWSCFAWLAQAQQSLCDSRGPACAHAMYTFWHPTRAWAALSYLAERLAPPPPPNPRVLATPSTRPSGRDAWQRSAGGSGGTRSVD